MTSSERPSPEPLLKKRRPQPYCEASNALNFRALEVSGRTLEGNSRKSSESASGGLSGTFPEFLVESLRRVWPICLDIGRMLRGEF